MDQKDFKSCEITSKKHSKNLSQKIILSELLNLWEKPERNISEKLPFQVFLKFYLEQLQQNPLLLPNKENQKPIDDQIKLKEHLNSYYEQTTCFGTIKKIDCMTLHSDYFVTLIHKINAEGFFKFQIDEKIVFGYQFKMKKLMEIITLEQVFNSDKIDSQQSQVSRINNFYIFVSIDQNQEKHIDSITKRLHFIGTVLYELENIHLLISNSLHTIATSNIEAKNTNLKNIIKERDVGQLVFINYISRIVSDELTKILIDFYYSIVNKTEFILGQNIYEYNVFRNLEKYKPILFSKGCFSLNPWKTIIFHDKEEILKNLAYERLKHFVVESNPDESVGQLSQRIKYPFEEIELYAQHFVYWESASIIEVLDDEIELVWILPQSKTLIFLNHQNQVFSSLFKISLFDVFRHFSANRIISCFLFKKVIKWHLEKNNIHEKVLSFLIGKHAIKTKRKSYQRSCSIDAYQFYYESKFVENLTMIQKSVNKKVKKRYWEVFSEKNQKFY